MRKLRYSIFFACLILLSTLLLFSCGSNLSTPDPMLNVDTQTLEWVPIKHASYYTIRISSDKTQEYTTLTSSMSLEFLEPGVYEVSIKANSTDKAYGDSEWIKVPYERFAESGLKYELINNGKEYKLVGAGTATGDIVMESTFRGKPVTEIADKAFYNNIKITGFTVGDNVKIIGEKAFTKCANLAYIIIPEGVTSMNQYAFQSCKSLTTVSLPDSLTKIPSNAFAWCSAITEIKIGNAVTDIGEYAFANCEALTKMTYNGMQNTEIEINLPATLTSISQYAFTDCTGFKSIDLGGNVKNIELGAFMNCSALENVDLGTSLTTIGESAFQECTALTSIVIPDSTEMLGKACFLGNIALTDVKIGTGMKDIGHSAFKNTAIMNNTTETLIIDGWLINLATESKVYTLPEGVYGIASYAASALDTVEQLNLAGVKYVCEAAFNNSKNLFRATFDDSLISLGAAAFYSCKNLKTVILGNSLETVGNYAFFGCEKIGSDINNIFTLPDTVTSVGTQAFRNTKIYSDVNNSKDKGVVYVGAWAVDFIPGNIAAPTILTDTTIGIANYAFCYQSTLMVRISDSVKYIGRGAFCNSTIFYITLPAELQYVGDYAFYGCYMTNFGGERYELIIPEGTEYIGRSAFYDCQTVLTLAVPGTVKEIGDYAFFNCANVGATYDLEVTTDKTDEDGVFIKEIQPVTGSLILSEGIESIGDRAFQNCINLVHLDIPDSVTTIGYRTFYRCQKLKTVTVGSGLTDIPNYMFYNCAALESVTLSDKTVSIGDQAFRGCISLNNIDLGGTKTIGKYAFYDCAGLKSIHLPESLVTIKEGAFRGCTAMTSVIIPANVTSIGSHAFYGLKNTTIYTAHKEICGEWNTRFNSSFRPIIFGAELSEDGSYVVSIVKTEANIENILAINGISDPTREGYDFIGWTTQSGSATAEYTSQNLADAEEGAVLYAVWSTSNDNQTEG